MRAAFAAAGALAAFTYLWRLGVPTWHRDEWAYANAGYRYVGGGDPANLEHPPLAKFLMGLSEQALGFSTTSARLPAVAAALATGIALALIARRLAGPGTALIVFVLWVILPHPWPDLRVDRLALLDTFAAAFAAFALLLALRVRDRPRRCDVLLLGAAIGAAAACKATGALIAVPVAVLIWPSVRALLGAAVVAPAVFLASYVPLATDPVSALRFAWNEQRRLSEIGFPLEVAGDVYQHPPWWSAVWFAFDAGPLLLVATLLLALAGARRLDRRVAIALGAAIVVPAAVVAFGHGRFFEHYAYAWAAPLTLLAGIGAARLRWLPATAVLVVAGTVSLAGIATLERADYALAGDALRAVGARRVLVVGAPTSLAGYVAPGTVLLTDPQAGPFDAVVVDDRATGTAPAFTLEGRAESRYGPVRLFR